MTQQVGTLVTQLSRLISDEHFEDVTEIDWFDYINEAIIAAISVRPDICLKTESIPLIAGSFQTLPADGLLLKNIHCNCNNDGSILGANVYKGDRESLDTINIAWRSETSTEFKEWMPNQVDERSFDVYPSLSAPSYAFVTYAYIPIPIDDKSDNIPVLDTAIPALKEFCLYRYYARDDENTPSSSKAGVHFQRFNTLLGLSVNGEQLVKGGNDA